jgi:hypothetical protein
MSLNIFYTTAILLSVLVVVSCQDRDDNCTASAGSIESCQQTIGSACKNATFIANRSAYSDQCSPVEIFWDAPLYNMTILFESQFMKPYSFCIEPVSCAKAFRTLDDGREVNIEWQTFSREPVCFATERSDRPTMKFRFDAGTQWRCYGTFIRFFFKV